VLTSLANMFPNLKFAVAEYNSDLAPNQVDTEIRQANDIAFNLNTLGRQQGAGAFFWEPTRTPNAQNPGMFTVSGRVYTAIPGCLSQFDQMKAAYGL
jgi:arabinogalactan endo-1,4-beta-galactosidase